MIRKLLKTDIFKNVAILVTGTALAQIILISFQLILRRVYSVEEFGVFGLYMSILGVWVIVSTMRYELAVVLPEKDEDAENLAVGTGILAGFFCIICLILIITCKSLIIKYLEFPESHYYWLYFLPFSAFLFSSYQAINYYLIRKKRFRASSMNRVARRVSEGIVMTATGNAGKKTGLVLGDLTGNFVNILSGIYQAKRAGFSFRNVRFYSIRQILKRYLNFPKFQAIPAILNTVSMLLPIVFVNKFFGEETLGYFDFSRQLLLLPLALISLSVSQALLKEVSDRKKNRENLTRYMLNLSLVLAVIIVPVIVVIVLWAPWLFSLVFSDVWRTSGDYSRILVFAFSIQFIVSPVSIMLTALEKLKIAALWQVLYFIAIAALYFLKGSDIEEFIIFYTIINLVAYFVYWLLIIGVANNYDRKLSKTMDK
ncbi:MAG: oligosaccharide flippase family protein [Bacteroidota bacterium]